MVGPHKQLGYLPLEEAGNPSDIKRQLESRGIRVLELTQSESNVYGGAVVAYDPKALGKLLKSRVGVLRKNKWPTDVDEFVKYHMKHQAKFKTELFELIADAYADYTNPYRRDSQSTIKVAMKYLRFGTLRLCQSHLL